MTEEKIDLRNPFAGFNANLMDDNDIIRFWIEPKIKSGRQARGIDLTGDIPVVVEGGRGTGKTMLLKIMSNDVSIKKYIAGNGDGKHFLEQTHFLGIYHRFDGPSLGAFHKEISQTTLGRLFLNIT